MKYGWWLKNGTEFLIHETWYSEGLRKWIKSRESHPTNIHKNEYDLSLLDMVWLNVPNTKTLADFLDTSSIESQKGQISKYNGINH